jgi:hypothetical protein
LIYDQATDTVVGNLGWVDHGSLWLYSVASGIERRIAVEGAAHLGVRPGLNGFFRLAHHESAGVMVSIRQYENPGLDLATLHVVDNKAVLAGEDDLWRHVDPAVIVQTGAGPRLLRAMSPISTSVGSLASTMTSATKDWSTVSPCLTSDLLL